MEPKFLSKLIIQGELFRVYVWNDMVAMNAREEEIKKKYMAFPERYKIEEDNPYGADGFIDPTNREIHLVWGDYYDMEQVLRSLAHEVAHAIFFYKDKYDCYKDEKIVECCAETYAEIYKCVESVRKEIESRKTHA